MHPALSALVAAKTFRSYAATEVTAAKRGQSLRIANRAERRADFAGLNLSEWGSEADDAAADRIEAERDMRDVPLWDQFAVMDPQQAGEFTGTCGTCGRDSDYIRETADGARCSDCRD